MDGQRDYPGQEPGWYDEDRGYGGGYRSGGPDRYAPDGDLPRQRSDATAPGDDREQPGYPAAYRGDYPERRYDERTDVNRYGDLADRARYDSGPGGFGLSRPGDGSPGGSTDGGFGAPGEQGRLGEQGRTGEQGRAGEFGVAGEQGRAGYGRVAEFPLVSPGRSAEPGNDRPATDGRAGLPEPPAGAPGRPGQPGPDVPGQAVGLDVPGQAAGPGQPPGIGDDRDPAFATRSIDVRELRRGRSAGAPDPASGAGVPPAATPASPTTGVYGGAPAEGVYRSRRPLRAVLLAALTGVFELAALRVLLNGVLADPVGVPAVVSGLLLVLGLPALAAGVYGISTGSATLDAGRSWLRPPTGYLVTGLTLLVAAALATH
ncbi:hypothetical protein ACFFWC_02010 [Plantactinospora siamensis]|uniref:Collagen-like protein n=1 Tax=Plantactinospora siamensis TaxID=555372 RepID=A0ABV6NUD3_9ACTN